MKRFLYVCCILGVLCNLCSCTKMSIENEKNVPAITTKSCVDSLVADDCLPAAYDEIVSDYERLICFRLQENFEAVYNQGERLLFTSSLSTELENNAKKATHWHNMLVEMTRGLYAPSKDDFSYVLVDLNDDGEDELVWQRKDREVLAIFTLKDAVPHLVDAFWSRSRALINEDDLLYTYATGGSSYTQYARQSIDSESGEMVVVHEFGVDGVVENKLGELTVQYYERWNDGTEVIDKERFESLLKMTPFFDLASQGKHKGTVLLCEFEMFL